MVDVGEEVEHVVGVLTPGAEACDPALACDEDMVLVVAERRRGLPVLRACAPGRSRSAGGRDLRPGCAPAKGTWLVLLALLATSVLEVVSRRRTLRRRS